MLELNSSTCNKLVAFLISGRLRGASRKQSKRVGSPSDETCMRAMGGERRAENGDQNTNIDFFVAKFSNLEYISEIFPKKNLGQFLRPLTVDPRGLKIEKFFFSYYRALTFQ